MTFLDWVRGAFTAKGGGAIVSSGGTLPIASEFTTTFDFLPTASYDDWRAQYIANPVLQGCVSALSLTMTEPPLGVVGADGRIEEHPINDLFDEDTLAMAITAIGIGGNAYLLKIKEQGVVTGFQVLTDAVIAPQPNGDGSVRGYWHYIDGKKQWVDKDDVVHLCGFWQMPDEPWKGTSPVMLANTAVESYNESTRAIYSIQKNDQVARTLVMYDDELSEEQQAVLKETFRQRHGGENRGATAHMWGVKDVKRLALDWDEMGLGEMFSQFETRICAVYRIHPIIAFTYAGLTSSTYSNFGQASKDFTTLTRIPLWNILARQITQQMQVEYPGAVFAFDTTKVASLTQPLNKAEEVEGKRLTMEAYTNGVISQEAALRELGYEEGDAGEAPQEREAVKALVLKAEQTDDVWVKAIDSITEEMSSDLTKPLAKVIGELETEVLKSAKEHPADVVVKRDPFDLDKWIERFLAATKTVREEMVDDLIGLSLGEVGADIESFGDAYTEVREIGIDESSSKIADSVGTIRDDVQQVLRDTAGKKPEEITEALKGKFKTLKDSRARMIARTTATATTGTSQRATWTKMNEREDDPKRKIRRRWISLPGARKTHGKVKGDYEDENGKFKVGKYETTHPAGPGLGAEEAVNCRCYTRPVRVGQS